MKNGAQHWIWVPIFLIWGGIVGYAFRESFSIFETRLAVVKIAELIAFGFVFIFFNMVLSPYQSLFHSRCFVFGELIGLIFMAQPWPQQGQLLNVLGLLVISMIAMAGIFISRTINRFYYVHHVR